MSVLLAPARPVLGRWLRRFAAAAALAAAAVALYLVVGATLASEPAVSLPATTAPPERPASAPERIPAWAWELHAWQLTPPLERGARPSAAPARVPAWYWDWRRWRLRL